MFVFARLKRRVGRLSIVVVIFLFIELLDELVFGVREAAMPLIRDALQLDYIQIGILLSVPNLIASFIEPFIGIFGDTAQRKRLMLMGGLFFVLALIISALSNSFLILLMAFIIFYPASGAFVNLAQAYLMDYEPQRHDQNMARWTLAGSLGVVAGPILLSIGLGMGIDWRGLFIGLSIFSILAVILSARYLPSNFHASEEAERPDWRQSFRNAGMVLRQWKVMRWVVLLEFSNLMMDILLGYLALYFVDVVGLTPASAAFAISVWTGIGFIGDFALVLLIERVDGLRYLRISAALEFILYTAFLLVDNFFVKLIILGLLGFFNAGWYSVLQGRLYSSLNGLSALSMTVNNIGGLFGFAIPLIIGVIASQWGLGVAMWFMLLGPIALLVGLPRESEVVEEQNL